VKTDEKGEKTTVENFFEATYVPTIARTAEKGYRSDGLRAVIGQDLVDKFA
jgi:hypothetical protein